MSTRLVMSALAALTLTSLGQAQTAPATAPAAAPAAAAPATVATPAVNREKDTLSVDFPDEDIKTILRNVADLFELNLVVPDTLVGKTSIKLRDVTWRQIFSVVLSPVNFTYIEDGNIIKIVSNDSLQVEPTSTDVFVLNYAKAADIKPTVDGLVDTAAGGKILVDARSNALVVTERPSRMGRVRNIIEQLDKATDQVMIESKFVEVTDRDVRNLGVNWAGLQNLQVGVGGIKQQFTKSSIQASNDSGTLTLTPTKSTVTTTKNTGTTLSPVVITDQFGNSTTTYQTIPTNTDNTVTTTSSGTDVLSQLAGLTNTGTQGRIANALFSASDFNVVISALKSLNSVKVVSNPTVVTLNNTEATLNIGEEFPIPSYTYNSERGAFEVSGFTYKPIGVILKVTPQVNARGTIKMSIEPEVSQRNGETSFGGAGGASIPIIATRKVKTQISIQSGYTAGIGGLISATKNNGKTKVPVLGDIPGLGRLFSSKSVNDTTSNLLIFITANTCNAEGATPEQVFDPRAMQAAGVTREDLPGQRAAKGQNIYLQAAPAEKE